jgi:hypothetical protein
MVISVLALLIGLKIDFEDGVCLTFVPRLGKNYSSGLCDMNPAFFVFSAGPSSLLFGTPQGF